jgi:DNA-binding response OmpR family regulator
MAKKILIVEDDTFLQGLGGNKTYQRRLFSVAVASNTPDAEKYVTTETPDFVLLDLVLPGTSGFEVLKTFRATPKL